MSTKKQRKRDKIEKAQLAAQMKAVSPHVGKRLNPEYDKATHVIWFMGLESWEDFCMREFGEVKELVL
jgi:hypothetical protein